MHGEPLGNRLYRKRKLKNHVFRNFDDLRMINDGDVFKILEDGPCIGWIHIIPFISAGYPVGSPGNPGEPILGKSEIPIKSF